jgi:hypothetical protein
MADGNSDPVIPLGRKRPDVAEAAGAALAGEVIPVRLEGVFLDWIRVRAQVHGETPADHIGRLLRYVWQGDPWRAGGPKA